LIVAQLAKKFFAFSGIQRFITVFTKARQWTFIQALLWPLWHVILSISMNGSCHPNPQAGGPHIVGCPRLAYTAHTEPPSIPGEAFSIRNVRTRHAVMMIFNDDISIAKVVQRLLKGM
jgi:hypothetical protein